MTDDDERKLLIRAGQWLALGIPQATDNWWSRGASELLEEIREVLRKDQDTKDR